MFAMFALLVGDINVLLIAVINSVGAQKCKVLIICNKKKSQSISSSKISETLVKDSPFLVKDSSSLGKDTPSLGNET